MKLLSRVRLFATPWTVAYKAPLSMEFSRQEYWSGLPFLSPGDFPNPGIKPRSPALQAGTLPSEPPGKPLLACEMSAIVQYFEHSLALPFFGTGMKTDLFLSCSHAEFSKCAGILSVALSQHHLEKSERDGNTRAPDLPLEKPICRSGSNS